MEAEIALVWSVERIIRGHTTEDGYPTVLSADTPVQVM